MSLLNALVEKAEYIYRKAREREPVRGRDITALLAAIVYLAYREMRMPRTMNEIAMVVISNINLLGHLIECRYLSLIIKFQSWIQQNALSRSQIKLE
jgi:transcription initiation factor TFIIIB Brf1 subunit/transcription initiation factor TFIIB